MEDALRKRATPSVRILPGRSPNTWIRLVVSLKQNAGDFDLFTYLKNPEVFTVKEGMIDLLTEPGLGITINEELVRRCAEEHKDFSWRNPIFRGQDGGPQFPFSLFFPVPNPSHMADCPRCRGFGSQVESVNGSLLLDQCGLHRSGFSSRSRS